ncbi:MAG: MBG domain-containing protein [Prosthecobacter sp.]
MVSNPTCLSRNFFVWLLALVAATSTVLAAPPAAPSGLSTTYSLFDSTARVWLYSWTDNSTDEDGFTIRFRMFDGAQWHDGVVDHYPGDADSKAYTGPWNPQLAVLGSSAFCYPSLGNWYGYQVQFYAVAYKGNPDAPTEVSVASNVNAMGPAPIPQATSLLAPTNLVTTTAGDGSIHLSFLDNSNCEQYFHVDYKKSSDSTWQPTGLDFTHLTTVSTDFGGYKRREVAADQFLPNFLPGTSYDFRVRAVAFDPDGNGAAVAPATAYSNTASATTQAFKAPTGLTATRVGENTFDLTFSNNSTADSGYQFQYRTVGSSTWLELGTINDPYFNTINSGSLPPNTNYEFQVRAFMRTVNDTTTTPVYSAFSNTATGTSIFTAPTNLTATSPSEGKVNLAWTDNSSAEGNYEIQVRVKGAVQWTVYDYLNSNTTSLTNQVVAPGEILEFQVRATYGSQAEVVSAFTNIAEVTTTFNPPTGFTATASTTDAYRISFAWTDNSAVESHYELQYRKVGETNYATRKFVPANGGTAPNSMSLANLPEFDPGSVYDVRVRAVLLGSNGTVISGTAFVTGMATTMNGFSTKPYAPITMGTPFSYQMATLSQQERTDWSVGTLPSGLSFDSVTGVISGTPAVSGLFIVPMTATFSGGTSHVLNLALRILPPTGAPQIAEAIGQQALAPGGTATVPLGSKFADRDTEAAVRLTTSKGNLDVVLYTTQTPTTVANFRAYNYADTIFHRAPTGFVLQGGGYKIAESPDVFDSVTRQSPIINEPGISNLYGTVAMAKVGDDPNSATSEFFFSLGNNSLNLDNQNGGFTVFGRLSAPSTNVLNTLASVPTSSYSVKLRDESGVTPSAANFVFSDIPIEESPLPTSINQDHLLKITAVEELPILTYAITTAPDSGVATAVLNGTDLQITAVATGTTTLVITATDVDANLAQQTVTINVSQLPGTVTLDTATLTQVYNGSARQVTATTTPAGLGVAYTYDGSSTPPTDAGSYAVVATIVDANYGGTTSGTLVVAKAPATLTLNGLDQVYDGTAKAVTATTTPAGLNVSFTYDASATAPANHGSYAVVATISDTNHEGTKGGTLVIRGQTTAEWRAQKFTEQQINAGVAGDDGDPDGDGLKNLAEYALGADPNSTTPPLAAPVRDGNGFTLTFTRPKGLSGVIYGAESSDSMAAGSWTPLTVELVTDGPVQTVRVRDPLNSGNLARRFIRLLFQAAP